MSKAYEVEDRQGVIDGLRKILDLFEQHPDLPMPNRFIGLVIYGADEKAFAELDAIAAMLRAAGHEVKDDTTDERREVQVDVGEAYFYVRHYLDASDERLAARLSYTDNVQVGVKAVSA